MNNLTLVVMATLCTLLIACNKEEIVVPSNYGTQGTDNITVKFTDTNNVITSFDCTNAVVEYYNSTSALIELEFSDDTSITTYGDHISLVSTSTTELDVAVGSINHITEDLNISICGSVLCYENSVMTITGSGVDFIVDDIPTGF